MIAQRISSFHEFFTDGLLAALYELREYEDIARGENEVFLMYTRLFSDR